ncbi:alpha/beta fold hydrolase [Marinomonas pollencensis]|uniref:Pimeloyl-ACP methyl ester carboxylesterase n=1 Tax=Marinomonas pollencensis TaxID=491954 RepID=A0A3E0DF45_9GAMM|nr:alpha/beta hydrolase [Marinomonas pollencensis]REG81197.1 pimeloyl-ACP methyl ester carboxylesterase [Marinomonas pollencensis]
MSLHKNEWLDSWRHEFVDGYIVGYAGQCHPERPNLHFLHGNGFAVQTYRQFLTAFDEDYNLILQEAAGHGRSSAGKRFVGWNNTAKRFSVSLKAQTSTLPQQPTIGMGHSFGGCMTLLMSAQQPDLFDRLILLDPALFPPRLLWLMRTVKILGLKHHAPLAKQARRRRKQWESLDQVRANLTGRGAFKGWEPACLEDYIQHSIRQDQASKHYHLICPSWMEAAVFSSYPKGLWQAIRSISVPTYIVQGEETFSYFKLAYKLAEKINPNIKVIEVKGGHCFMQQYPQQSAQTVKTLISQQEVQP